MRGETTTEKGRRGEEAAVALLEELGYRVLERNARTRRGEIDVVAWDGEVLCFVEVRSRADERYGGPLASVGREKQGRVVAAASAWLARLPPPWPRCRFDVVARTGEGPLARLSVVRGAFDAPA